MSIRSLALELVVGGLGEATSMQLDEDRHVLFVLSNDRLTRVDLTQKETHAQVVHQHNRRFGVETHEEEEEEEEEYSQGESDDERVGDPFEDSEPSTDDDEDSVANRRNWRRYGWRIYRLDNPTSILFVPSRDELVVLNEGVITRMKFHLKDNQPFVDGASQNIFCYDYPIFQQSSEHRLSVQPWSITRTSIDDYFIFSLLERNQIYSLNCSNNAVEIDQFASTEIDFCPSLVFHRSSNAVFVYDSTRVFVISFVERTINRICLAFLPPAHSICSLNVDGNDNIYVLSQKIIYKCSFNSSQLHLVECLGKLETNIDPTQMIVNNSGKEFFVSEVQTGSIHRIRLEG